jgi:site-specific DNA-methyltransferase (adenine-specific)
MKMAEKVVIGNAELWHGDALEVLPLLPAVDAVITDPPFNARKAIANDNLDPKAWRAFCNRLALALWANGAPNVLVETGKDDATMRQELERWMPYRYAVMLNYTNSMRNGAVGFANFGLVYWFGEGKCHERYMDRLDAALISTKDEFTHPTPKMVPHYARLVAMFSPKGGTVLDPFAGSGTTGVAAVQSGRRFIGIELAREHFDTACRRIEQAQAQVTLLAEASEPMQVGML